MVVVVGANEDEKYFKNSVNLIFCGVWHRISTEDDLRILQYDVLQGVSKRVGFALEDKRAAVLLSPAVASKHHLKRENYWFRK